MAPREALRTAKEGIPPKPKKPMCSYLKFRSEEYKRLRDANKEWDVEKINAELTNEWATLDEKKKKKYEESYEKDNEKFKKDLVAWRTKYGENEEDGKKSGKK